MIPSLVGAGLPAPFSSSFPALPTLVGAAGATTPTASTPRLVIAALISIVVIVVLIVWVKMHPFFALMLGSGVMAVAASMGFENAFT